MEFLDVIKKRRSTRAFQQKKVPDELLQEILLEMQEAPSAGNIQAYQVVVVSEEKTKKSLAEASLEQMFLAEAPVVLCFFADPQRSSRKYGRRGAELYSVQDATIAAAYLQLAAANAGLASAWVGAFDSKKVSAVVNAPSNLIPVALIPLGYAAETPVKYPRRSLSEVVKKEEF